MIRSGIFSLATVCLAISAPVSFWVVLPLGVSAQNSPETIPSVPDGAAAPAGTVSCFDYYRFGSVQVDLQSSTPSTVTGVPITFTGTITNTNEYPIVDGAVYVKIFKVDRNSEKNTAGPDVVDQFFAKRDVHLPAKGSQDIEVTWAVPGHLPTGDYMLGTYFTVADSFNLLGLSFTDDVVGNMANFSVVGELAGSVAFDKSAVTVNTTPYHFAAYPPQIPLNDEVTIEAPLVNGTNSQQAALVTWQLYAWDALKSGNVIDTTTEPLTLAPHTTTTVTYTTTQNEHPVYYLVGTVHFQDSKSIIGVRFVREEVAKTRINFPGITSFPLLEGQEATLFSCLHGMGQDELVPGGKLVLTLADPQGDIIHSYTYTGDVSGAMMGVRDMFVPDRDYHRFTLTAQLYQDDTLVDEAMMNYDCGNLSSISDCPEDESTTSSTGGPYAESGSGMKMFLLIGAGIIALGVAAALGLRRRPQSTTPLVFGLGLILTSVLVWGALPQTAEAKSVQWSEQLSADLQAPFSFYALPSPITRGIPRLVSPHVAITYLAEILEVDNNVHLIDNDRVPVGTKLQFQFTPHHFEHIYWVGSGQTFDTPYGDWVTNAQGPNSEIRPINIGGLGIHTCQAKDFLTRFVDYWDFFVVLAVNPPAKTITGVEGLSCGSLTSAGTMDCTVTGPGPVTAVFTFAPTYGKFYGRYIPESDGVCYGSNEPFFPKNNPAADFQVEIPQQTISFTFTAVGDDTSSPQPPNTPVITGPTTGLVNTPHTFQVKATDPANQQLKYCIDWEKNGTCQWLPAASGFVAPGIDQPFTRLWPTTGAKPFQVKACNVHALCSGWATHTITLQDQPPPTASLTCAPAQQTVNTHELVNVTSSAGSLSAWWAPDGNQKTGTGASFGTAFATPGAKTVKLAAPTPPYYDVNGDGYASPADLLELITAGNAGTTSAPGTNGGPWQNQANRLDVNNDGVRAPSDLSALFSYLSSVEVEDKDAPLPTAACQVQVMVGTPTPTPTPTPTATPTTTPTPTGGPFNPGPIRETE